MKTVSSTVVTKLNKLADVAANLNLASDELTELFHVLDDRLQELNVGLVVWVPMQDQGPGPSLGYAKLGGRWGLAIAEENVQWPIGDAPRKLRLLVSDHIPELLDELHAAAADMTGQLENAKSECSQLLAGIKKEAANG